MTLMPITTPNRRYALRARSRLARFSTICVALLWTIGSPTIRAADNVPLAIGAPAPAISEPTKLGPYDSSTSRRPYVLELFAVWCPHCQREVTALNRLVEVDGERVDIIAVPASPFGFDKARLLNGADLDAFANRFHTEFRIGFDGFFSLAYDYGVASFPTIYFVDGARRVVAVESGEVPFEKLHADVDALFAHPAPSSTP